MKGLIVIVLAFLILPSKNFSQGFFTTVTTNDGTAYSGELIFVRPNSLFLYEGNLGRNQDIKSRLDHIRLIDRSNIRQIAIHGRSYVWTWVLVGVAIPAAFVYLASDSKKEYLNYGLAVTAILSGLGGIAGVFIGKHASIKDQSFLIDESKSLEDFKRFARISGEEPIYLKDFK